MEAPQRLHRPNVGGCGRRIARYDEPVPDECLPEEAHDNDDQIQHSADSCVSLWRCFNVNICHFGSLGNLTSTSRNGLTKRDLSFPKSPVCDGSLVPLLGDGGT